MDHAAELREEIKRRIDTVGEAMLYRIYTLLEAEEQTEPNWWDELDSDLQ